MEKQIKEQIAIEAMKSGKLDVVYLTGKALEPTNPRNIEIKGSIDAPLRYAKVRKFYTESASVQVSREKGTITLETNEHDEYGRTRIVGELVYSDAFRKMRINTYDYVTTQEMAERIKMNRAYFSNKAEAMKLVSDLQNFKAKVNKQIEDKTDNRGNRDLVYNQAVESNIPKSFCLYIPIFKGLDKTSVECEVYINPTDLKCTLISADANEQSEGIKDKIIDDILGKLDETECGKGIAVIEV